MEYEILPLLKSFIGENRRNKRTQKGGQSLTSGTKRNYLQLYKLLSSFNLRTNYPLRLKSLTKDKRVIKMERQYYSQFYRQFTDFLYDDLGHFDNYVGHNIKMLKTFLNWVSRSKGLYFGEFYKDFYVWKEDIPIVVLDSSQLRFLITNKPFHDSLPLHLQRAKDLFVFGCATALRVSDLLSLLNENIEIIQSQTYLSVTAKKTRKQSVIKLPDFTKEIIARNKNRGKRLFPITSSAQFGQNVKKIGEMAGWTNPVPKIRTKRGKPITQYKNNISKSPFRFCDLLSTHTMRRTAITTMLELGMEESTVRKISGHSPGSVEFYKYVKYHQERIDQHTDIMFEKLVQNSEI